MPQPSSAPLVTRAAARDRAQRLESSGRAERRSAQEVIDLPPGGKTHGTPTCSKAQDAERRGAQGRSIMRSVGLDLGVRNISYCEVLDGKVVDRTTVRKLSQLASRIGPNCPMARVAFESCREGWHVHDKLIEWGHEPHMLDTTRIRRIGVGQHKRKNDAIDAETIAIAVESGRIPEAHVLSPERRVLRAQLSVRGALVETRAQYITTIRGLGRAAGVLLPTCEPENFTKRLSTATLDEATRRLVDPLTQTLVALETQLVQADHVVSAIAEREPIIKLLATVPGVGLIVAATFVSVVDEANRFRNAHAVGAYLGLVPSEATTGGPSKRRLGSITKQGNSFARSMLIQAAWCILRMRDAEDPLRKWADHLRKTRGATIAAVALARKLAGVLWAMWRDNTVYDRPRQAEQHADGVRKVAVQQAHRADALERASKKLRRPAPRANPDSADRPKATRAKTQEVHAV